MDGGDAKVAGVAVEVVGEPQGPSPEGEPPEPSHSFQLDLHEAVLTSLHSDGDRLVIEVWRPGEGVERIERA